MRIEPVVSLGHLIQVAATILAGLGSAAVCVALGSASPAPAVKAAPMAAHYESFGPPAWIAARIVE